MHPIPASSKKEKVVWLLSLNLLAITVHFFVIQKLGFPGKIQDLFFSTQDAQEYKAMGEWLFGDQRQSCSATRPFLFPLLVKLALSSGSIYGAWFMQFSLWLVSLNFIYTATKILLNKYWAAIAFTIMLLNFSLITLTLHGLTEVMVVFILSCFLRFIATRSDQIKEPGFWHNTLLLLSLLAVVKPVYAILLYVTLIIYLCFAFWNPSFRKWKSILLVTVSLIPFLMQLSIMKLEHGEFSISRIGEITLRDYYYAKFYADTHRIPFDLAKGPAEKDILQVKEQIQKIPATEIIPRITAEPLLAVKIYTEILLLNLTPPCTLINLDTNRELYLWTYTTNAFYYHAHKVMLLLVPLFFLLQRKNKNVLVPALFLILPLLLILLTSGITYWQGDRVILPSLPLFIVLYSYVISKFITLITGTSWGNR